MVKRIVKTNYSNFIWMSIGAILFFLSFHVGEGSLLGGFMHLSGCACFCSGIHGIHDVKMEDEIHPHPHH